jgi:hypothetical protein
MLDAADISSMRSTAALALVDTGTVSVPEGSATTGSQGGKVDGAPTVYNNVACWLQPLGSHMPEESRIAERLSLKNPAVIYLKHDQPVTERSTITIGSQVFTVRGIPPESDETRILKTVVADETK